MLVLTTAAGSLQGLRATGPDRMPAGAQVAGGNLRIPDPPAFLVASLEV